MLTVSKKINVLMGFLVLGISSFLVGCPSSTQVTKKSSSLAKKNPLLLPKAQSKKVLLKKRYFKRLPKGIETVVVKKGIPLYLFLHPKGLIRSKPFKSKAWKNQMVMRGRSRSWYVRLKPQAGAKLGRYVFIRTIMAVWNAAGNFGVTARVSFQFLLRRGKKETLLFSTMQLPKGQRYQAYDVTDREINYNNESERVIKEGDILIFRVKHRSGNGGSVALGGGLGPRGNFFVISNHSISNYYQYTK